MKKLFFPAILLFSSVAFADDPRNEWHNTTLTEATIKKVQESRFQYKKCVAAEMQKTKYAEQDSRRAAELIVKECEPALAKMRAVYIDEKVPEVIADRHLKQLRLQTTRSVIQSMMFAEAARQAGQSGK
ncbi:MAG: hypothetical protein ACU84H_13675 [Gammaproteobacteria bacterium]